MNRALVIFLMAQLMSGCLSGEDLHVKVENGLRSPVLIADHPEKKWNLLERMAHYQVPGVSLAVVNEGKIEWAQGYGYLQKDSAQIVASHTLFQAGSISKPISAYGVLLLVQQGKLALDEDVNRYLKRWKVPENSFTETVTLRRLLSHTAGINISGFPGYERKASLPSIVAILNGEKPLVNTEPVRVISKPGTEFKYSGGGTTIVQLLIEDVTGERFEIWMQKHVLIPLGMSESSFQQPLPPYLQARAASGYRIDGTMIEGQWHVYPEMAAAGLWTTPTDLAKFILAIQNAMTSGSSMPLASQYVKEMITPQKEAKETEVGLGLFLEHKGHTLLFEHNGQNEGFIAMLSGFAYLGKGAVIMMNSDGGWLLMEELKDSLMDAYQWPDSKPIVKRAFPLDPSKMPFFVGRYKHEESRLEIRQVGLKLMIEFENGPGIMELHASDGCTFFTQEADLTLKFPYCDKKNDRLILIDAKKTQTEFKAVMQKASQ